MTNNNFISIEEQKYIQAYVNSVAGYFLPLEAFSHDKVKDMFLYLSRIEEYQNHHRDQWGNWEASFSKSYLDGLIFCPWIDEEITIVSEQYQKENEYITKIDKYPENKAFALCLTHDVDSINHNITLSIILRYWRHLLRCRIRDIKAIKQLFIKPVYDYLTQSVKRLIHNDIYKFIEVEKEYGFKSTFYCFSDRLIKPSAIDSVYGYNDIVYYNSEQKHFREVITGLLSDGWDIGMHGSFNSYNRSDIMQYEKDSLESITKKEMYSIRQHWMHFDLESTPTVLQNVGFIVDSTLGFNRNIGFRAGVCHPFYLWDYKQSLSHSVLEIPQIIMDGALFYSNSLELDEKTAIEQCIAIMDKVKRVGGVLTISWHPDHLNKKKFFNTYKAILEEASRRKAWGCSVSELSQAWQAYQLKLVNQAGEN